jgi:hypothetical protein
LIPPIDKIADPVMPPAELMLRWTMTECAAVVDGAEVVPHVKVRLAVEVDVRDAPVNVIVTSYDPG